MGGPSDEISQLQKEWRARTTEELRDIRESIGGIVNTLSELRSEFAKLSDVTELRNRIASLESDRAKMLGGILVLNGIIGVILFVLKK